MFKKFKNYLIIIGISILGLGSFIAYQYLYLEPLVIESEEPSAEMIVEVIDPIILVDVKGAVKEPGVYEFVLGERVIDAINKAGGLNKNANTNNINLSQKLIEEMVVYVFTNTEIKKGNNAINCNTACDCTTITISDGTASSNENPTNTGKININTANLNQLITLPGIGEAKAQAIINYRETNGLFNEISDITKVSGIGQSTFENLKELITI